MLEIPAREVQKKFISRVYVTLKAISYVNVRKNNIEISQRRIYGWVEKMYKKFCYFLKFGIFMLFIESRNFLHFFQFQKWIQFSLVRFSILFQADFLCYWKSFQVHIVF